MSSHFYPHLFWRADPEEFNCSGKSYEEWKQTGEVSKALGTYFFIVGVITLICYIFVIYTMSCRFLLSKPCWKLMYFNCYVDCGNILVSSIFTGILFYDGGVYCTWPIMSYAGGGLGLGCWCASCVNCIAIAINRCSTICNKETGLFKGKRTYCWIGCSALLMIYSMLFSRPPIFNSKMGAWFYYPFIQEYEKEAARIINYVHPIVNCSTAAIITVLYSILCCYLCISGSRSPKLKDKFRRMHNKVFIQSAIVCCSSCTSCYVYAYMQFFPVPNWLIIWASFGYQICSALPCYVYLTLNTEFRGKAAGILRNSMVQKLSSGPSKNDLLKSPEPKRKNVSEGLVMLFNNNSDDSCCDEVFL